DLALLELARVVPAGNIALPRVARHLFQTQGDALALLIHVEDHAGHLVTFADHLARMADLAYPAHVADVQQSVDALLNFDKSAVIGQIAHRPGDDGPWRVALGHFIPGVRLNLLHAQGDFLLLLIDVQHLHFNLIADGDELARVVDALRPAHLANVYQAFDARLELHKGAV